jgi:hypothetical protein
LPLDLEVVGERLGLEALAQRVQVVVGHVL